MKCCVSTDVGTWTNWLTFEPDPDYSPDAGTGLLSPIQYALQRGILLRRENPTYWRGRSLQRGVVLKWFYSPRAVGTPLSEVRALYRVPSSWDICKSGSNKLNFCFLVSFCVLWPYTVCNKSSNGWPVLARKLNPPEIWGEKCQMLGFTLVTCIHKSFDCTLITKIYKIDAH